MPLGVRDVCMLRHAIAEAVGGKLVKEAVKLTGRKLVPHADTLQPYFRFL